MTDKPTPGSAEAVDLGCTCPIIDNHYGKGVPMNGKRFHWTEADCPLHGDAELNAIILRDDNLNSATLEKAIISAMTTGTGVVKVNPDLTVQHVEINQPLPHSEDDA